MQAQAIVGDYLPLASGNNWQFTGAYGTKVVRVMRCEGDSALIADSTYSQSGNSGESVWYRTNDSTGAVYYRDRSLDMRVFLGKHFFNPRDSMYGENGSLTFSEPVRNIPSVATPFGTFASCKQYTPRPGLIGRPHLIAPYSIAAPGTGLVRIQYPYLMDYETPKVWELATYQFQTVPGARSHSVISLGSGAGTDSLFSYVPLAGDSGRITFRIRTQSCAKFEVASSYHQARATLLLYAADTSSVKCRALPALYEHTLSVSGINGNLARIKVYFRETEPAPSANRLLYSIAIASSILERRHPSTPVSSACPWKATMPVPPFSAGGRARVMRKAYDLHGRALHPNEMSGGCIIIQQRDYR